MTIVFYLPDILMNTMGRVHFLDALLWNCLCRDAMLDERFVSAREGNTAPLF